jgi:RNA polymerase sigma-70 factor (sigma-E family)
VPNREREFREFFDAEFRPLRRLAYMLTGDWGEAEDLAQEAMVRVYRAWERIKERERPAAYARAVLVNRHRSMLRRARVEAKHKLARMPDRAPVVEMGEDHLLVWRALAELPAREREVLVLRYYEDMPQAEIAKVMGCPVGTVKSLTHRALGRLRDELGPEIAAMFAKEDV